MKKWTAVLLACILVFGSFSVFAAEMIEPAEPITYCEFITVLVQALDGDQPVSEEGHYAANYMQKAREMGLIGDIPVSEWEKAVPVAEKELILAKAKEYLALSNVTYDELRAVVNSRIISRVMLNEEILPVKVAHRNGQIMLPLRAVAEGLGYDVAWNNEGKAAIIRNGKIESTLTIGQNSYSYTNVEDGSATEPVALASAPALINGTTYVPVQFFDLIASYSISNQTLTVYSRD